MKECLSLQVHPITGQELSENREHFSEKFTIVADLNSQLLLSRLIADDSDAAKAIFDRYVERLLSLARSHMSAKLRRRLDADDVVQSAYRSFFVHAKNKKFQLDRAGDLWRLLAAITLNKLSRQVEKHTSAKRSLDCEEYLVAIEAGISITPSVAEVVALAEVMGLTIAKLSGDERKVLIARLQGADWDEISNSVGKSPRTVRRLIEQVENKMRGQLIATDILPPSQSASSQHTTNLVGLEYSNFVLEAMVGAGGMGKVYRAIEKSSGEVVALKSLHKLWNLEPFVVGRFAQEAEILLRLDHPNIVKVRGLGRYPAGGLFMVMDFVDGTNLESRLRTGMLTADEVPPLLSMIVSAVAYAHEQGVIHCDLKPENILLSRHQEAIVTDFGFALVMPLVHAELTSMGGTHGFIAPEILAGNPPSPKSDVFSLGAIFDQVLMRGELCDNLRTDLSAVRDRCLQGEPSLRYADARELLPTIRQIRSD